MKKTKIFVVLLIICYKAATKKITFTTYDPDPEINWLQGLHKQNLSSTLSWQTNPPRRQLLPGREVPHGDKLRLILHRQIFEQPTDGSSLVRFLLYGDKPKPSPLKNYKVLDAATIRRIAEDAKNQIYGSNKSATAEEFEFLYWERYVDFYSLMNRTVDGSNYDPMTMGKYFERAQETGQFEEKLKTFTRRFNKGPKNFVTNKTYFNDKQFSQPTSTKTRRGNEFRNLTNMRSRRTLDDEDVFAADEPDIAKYPFHFINSQLKLFMMQVIYATRAQLTRIFQIRQRFAKDPPYRMAVYYATALHNVQKLKTFITLSSKLIEAPEYVTVKFLPILVLYEKSLAAYTDVESIAVSVFDEQNHFVTRLMDKLKKKTFLDKYRDFFKS